MTESIHDRARRLIGTSMVDPLDAGDRQWLDAHLRECPACTRVAVRLREALSTLALEEVRVDDRLRARVLAGAAQPREVAAGVPVATGAAGPSDTAGVGIATALAAATACAAALALWTVVRGIGTSAALPVPELVTLTALVWMLPAPLVALAAAAFDLRGRLLPLAVPEEHS